jgi:hypothetical protein
MDILVRTSGEIRLSDFMLWQSSRDCHIEFIDCFWPEFTFWKLLPILLRYQLRATTIAQSRREYSQREVAQQEYVELESSNSNGNDVWETVLCENKEDFVMMSQRNSSESTLVTDEKEDVPGDDLTFSVSLGKKQRVSSFLHHRGHIPNCPIVQLQ